MPFCKSSHVSLVWILIWSLSLLTGCGDKPPQPSTTTPRIICTYGPAMEVAYALGLHPYLVGVAKGSDQVPLYRGLRPDIGRVMVVGGRIGGINLETMLQLKPTLVITFPGLDGKSINQKLQELGIAHEIIEMESLNDIQGTLRKIAQRLGQAEYLARVAKISSAMNRILAVVDAGLAAKPVHHKARIYFATNRSLLTTQSQKMLQHEMIERAGALDVVNVTSGGWLSISAEQLLAWNPDMIIISKEAPYSLDSIRQDVRFQEIAAVQQQRLYRMPDWILAWDYPGPDVALGILWMAKTCYPDAFANLDFSAEVEKFYQAVYEVSYKALQRQNPSLQPKR